MKETKPVNIEKITERNNKIKEGLKNLIFPSVLALIILGVIYVVRGVLTGTGDAFFALFNGAIEVVGRFTIPILMTSYFGMGAKGIWLSTGIVWAISGVTAWLRYYFHFHRHYFSIKAPVFAHAGHFRGITKRSAI